MFSFLKKLVYKKEVVENFEVLKKNVHVLRCIVLQAKDEAPNVHRAFLYHKPYNAQYNTLGGNHELILACNLCTFGSMLGDFGNYWIKHGIRHPFLPHLVEYKKKEEYEEIIYVFFHNKIYRMETLYIPKEEYPVVWVKFMKSKVAKEHRDDFTECMKTTHDAKSAYYSFWRRLCHQTQPPWLLPSDIQEYIKNKYYEL